MSEPDTTAKVPIRCRDGERWLLLSDICNPSNVRATGIGSPVRKQWSNGHGCSEVHVEGGIHFLLKKFRSNI